jgi:polyhydroxyalkanoate synthesis regulator phasin
MALKLPGLNFFSGTNAKSRVFILLASFVGVALLIYISIRILDGGITATGPSKVAEAPAALQSIPGSKNLSPEYYRTLVQANAQAAQQAQISGGSAVPTLINTLNEPAVAASGNCTILCPNEEEANVVDDINALVKAGKLSQKDANKLIDLAKKNVSVAEYAAALDELVRQGKLTPEQARLLLEKYKKQHANALLTSTANTMDALIKSGQLPLGVANELLELQKRKVTPAEYAAELARLVKEGKLSPAAAAQLLAQYTQQYAQEAAKEGRFAIQQMAKAGQITPDVAKMLEDMQGKNIPLDQYAATLDRWVAEGKITPAVAAKLLAQYRTQRTDIGAAGLLGAMLAKGGAFAAEAKRLLDMQANNVTLSDYAEELKRAVQAGLITPEEAASLLQQYQAMLAAITPGILPTVQTNIPEAADFARLQQRVQEKEIVAVSAAGPATQQFAVASAQAQAQALQDRQQRIQQLQTAMSGQAQSLLTAWQPVTLKHEGGGSAVKGEGVGTSASASPGASTAATTAGQGTQALPQKSLIKAGTIAYAVLDTAVDSDYPDTPIMATIVQGPLKGAKVIGKLSLAAGQDKVSLNFTQIDTEAWPSAKSISAFAVDPETARTVLASNVDHHYLKRYGAIMATSFLSGYANAITQAGTSTTGIFGTSSNHPELSPSNKLLAAIGQIGTNLNSTVLPYVNTPATVKVDSGVGIGILFVAEVKE